MNYHYLTLTLGQNNVKRRINLQSLVKNLLDAFYRLGKSNHTLYLFDALELVSKNDSYLLLVDLILLENVVDHWVQIYIRILKNGNE